MELILALAAVVLIVWAAVAGVAYRGVYFALAFISFAAGYLLVEMTGPAPPDADAALRRGTEVINAYAFPIATVMFGAAFGGVLGACLYRQKPRLRRRHNQGATAHPSFDASDHASRTITR